MHLNRLELSGFKSFANSTSLEFSPGVTAIIGPNGSGKSNIADAIRWILGEQSMKSIRSQNSKDLIFSGSKSKSRLSKASVSLYFDNSKKQLPLDYEEVVINRTIFRDGTSEYLINKNSAKLMDVVEILAKANIGHRGFSVINQGMESEILKYSSKEFYELLEEASGVRYLQLKKRRAERRLKNTETNLEKAASILKEITPHLKYLKREANKIEKKEKLKDKLINLQKKFFFFKINRSEKEEQKFTKQKRDLEEQSQKIKQEIKQLEKELQQEENNIQNSRNQFSQSQNALEEILDARSDLSEQLANLRAQVQMEKQSQPINAQEAESSINFHQAQNELKNIYSSLKEVAKVSTLEKIKEEINNIILRVEKIIKPNQPVKLQQKNSENLEKLLNKQKQLEQELESVNQKYQDQKNIMQNSQTQLNQEKFFEIERKLRKKKDNLGEIQNSIREVDWEIQRVSNNHNQLKEDIGQSKMNYQALKEGIDVAKQEQVSISDLEEKINKLKYKVEEIGGVDDITLKEYEETQERYNNLTQKIDDLKKAQGDLESLIKKLTKEIKTKFEEKFQIINNNFNKYFRLLFNGGKAYLKQIIKKEQIDIDHEGIDPEEEIEGQDQVASEGIEIKATLPGKKVKNLRMFSGGEKALTSIALLFAIISANPPPFLVLDEVDATLDESNSKRFAKLVREFSKDTQFIIISHNRETMNQADVLYGVTMGEQGVSSLVSLKLDK